MGIEPGSVGGGVAADSSQRIKRVRSTPEEFLRHLLNRLLLRNGLAEAAYRLIKETRLVSQPLEHESERQIHISFDDDHLRNWSNESSSLG